MEKYKLVNPNIQGSMKTTFNAKKPLDAAKKFYKTFSEYVVNRISFMPVTLSKDNELYHFIIKESKNNDDTTSVTYEIQELKGGFSSEINNSIMKQDKQKVSKHEKSLDSSSLSSSDEDNTENKSGSEEEINSNSSSEEERKEGNKYNLPSNEEQTGGKHKKKKYDDSSSSSSSDDEHYNNFLPIRKYVYYNLPYHKIYGLGYLDASRLVLPVFSFPVSPVYEILLELY